MANGAFKFKDNSGNVVSFISGSGSNISFSGGTLDLSGMTGLTLGNLTLSGTTQNALSASHAASYLLTSSFNTYSGTTNTLIGTLQTSTSSLNSFTSSATTRLNSIETSTGSLNSYTSSNNTKLGVIESTTGSLNSYTSSNTTNINAIHTSTGSLNTFTSSATTRLNSIEGVSGSYATTGSNLFKGNQTISGSIIPAVDNAYDLGSSTYQFRDLYLSSASLYIDGTKVLGSTAQELQITTDTGQSFKILEAGSDTITLQSADGNITLATSGGGDVIMDPTNGVIGLKGTVTIYTGNKITSSDGNSIQFGNGIAVTGSIVSTTTSLVSGSSQITYSGLSGVPSNIISGSGQLTTLGIATTGSNTFNGNLTVTGFIDTQELRTTYISSSILYRSGSTKFGDELTDTHSFTGSILISGSISVPGSNLVSGSSQVLNGSGVFSGSAQLPSGIVSSSAQTIANLPSGVVSGSAQTIANLPSGTVSGSSQVLAGTTIHSGSFFNGVTVVSGSVQVDVMSTTNIARLATTGSNVFTGAITGTSATFSSTVQMANGSQVMGGGIFKLGISSGNAGAALQLLGWTSGAAYSNWQIDTAHINAGFNITPSSTGGGSTFTTPALTILTSGAATFSSGVEAASFYTNDTRYIANQIQSGYNANSEDSDIWINYTGYQGGTTRFRDFRVGNGKQGQIALFDGSTGGVTFSGNLTLSSSSSTTDLGGVLIVRGNGSAYSTHYLTTGAANVAKYIQYNASGAAINQINAGGDSYITGGNFGIGISTPQGLLDVYKSTSGGLGGHIYLRNNGAAVGNEMAVMFVDGDASTIRAAISSTTEGSPYFGDIKFKTGLGTYSSLSTRMTISGEGKVGIGFTPSYKLQVAGEITTHAGTNTSYYAYMNYLGTTYNFGSGETNDNVDFKIAGGAAWGSGGNFRWFTQTGGATPTERFRITPTNAAFSNKLTVGGTTIYAASRIAAEGAIKASNTVYSWYQGGSNTWDNFTYLHLKTNLYGGLAGNTEHTMSLFHAKLYSYSANYIREGYYGFHNWSGTLYNPSSTGTIWSGGYMASDGNVVLVIALGTGSYIGLTIDWFQAYPYGFRDRVVTATTASNSATGVY